MPPKTRKGAAYIVESQAESQNNEQEQHQPEQSIPDVEAWQTNLLLELIQGLQQTQGELAETVRQLKEKSSKAQNDHQDGENHHENLHQEPSSHNNKEEPFITLSEVADLLQQEREKILKEPRHFVRKPPYPAELLKQSYLDNQECLPACMWKKILLIALESPELCSTVEWKTLKKGKSKDQKSCCMAAMVGSLYSAQLPKKNSENASLMVFKVPMNKASP
uniref:Uncharacterized protein n=1 Tax=Fagus sylvatica TaxID=28930 RepID=A0A2N9FZY4_FAGSY